MSRLLTFSNNVFFEVIKIFNKHDLGEASPRNHILRWVFKLKFAQFYQP